MRRPLVRGVCTEDWDDVRGGRIRIRPSNTKEEEVCLGLRQATERVYTSLSSGREWALRTLGSCRRRSANAAAAEERRRVESNRVGVELGHQQDVAERE